jgi:hypothetical protein
MWLSRFVLVFALLFFSTALALADVVPVSANRQIGASGTYFCEIPDICGTGLNGSFTVNDTSQVLGLYQQSLTGSTPGNGTSANVAQTSNAVSNAITLNTTGSGGGSGIQSAVVFDTNSLFSLEFTLAAPSQVHIFGNATGTLSLGDGLLGCLCFGASVMQSVVLTGPGVNFSPSIPLLSDDPLNPPLLATQTIPWDSTLTLLPGQYMIEATNDAQMGFAGTGSNTSASFDMSLTADFTPLSAVPEPSQTFPVLFGIGAAIYWRLRRRLQA